MYICSKNHTLDQKKTRPTAKPSMPWIRQAYATYSAALWPCHAYAGIWRNTKDLDVFVPREGVARVLQTLERAGFEAEVTDPCWLAKAWKRGFFLDVIHANDNGTGPVEEFWFKSAKETEILGRRVLVIPPEEMFLSKIFVASRDRSDLSAVLHLIFTMQGEFDGERILTGLGEHWELFLAYLHLYHYHYVTRATPATCPAGSSTTCASATRRMPPPRSSLPRDNAR